MISVCVPVYNGGAYLAPCIESVLGQTYADLELILVDDGSGDQSGEICDSYAQQDGRVRVIHQENQGAIASRMNAATASRGEYLMFVDCDDTLDPVTLEKMAEQLTGRKDLREVVCCNYVIDRNGKRSEEKRHSAGEPGVYTGEKLETKIKAQLLGNEDQKRTVILSMCMKLFSRKLVVDNLCWCDRQVRMGDDILLTVPAILDADRVVLMPEAYYYHYRFIEGSMVHSFDAGMFDNMQRVRVDLYQMIAAKKRMELEPCVEREYVYLYLLAMKNLVRRNDVPKAQAVQEIRDRCLSDHSAALMQKIPRPESRAEELLYLMCRHPSSVMIRLVRRIFMWVG